MIPGSKPDFCNSLLAPGFSFCDSFILLIYRIFHRLKFCACGTTEVVP